MLPPWTPDLVSLDLLLSVAEHGSVGRAAAAHGISQPSASARLSRLERKLGVPVLVRRTTGSTLTPAGEAVIAWAAGVVTAAHTLTDGVRTLREGRDARLRVAASLTVAEYLMPPWLLSLRRRHRDLDVAAIVENSSEVAEHVRSGAADIGFIESPDLPAGLTGQHVGRDRLALVVAAAHPLAGAEALTVADLPGLPLLLREPGSGTRDTFLRAVSTALALPEPPATPHATALGSTATIVATARAGGGVGVLSARAVAADLVGGSLVELVVPQFAAERPLTAIWLGRTPTPLAQELIAIAAGTVA
jgi:DNA-binding transcriptional LysR family regulator